MTRKGTAATFALVAIAWLLFDIATKAYFGTFEAGQVAGGPYLGLIQFRLAHNTGAAWGMFGGATFALGVMSLVVCAAMAVYLLAFARRPSACEVVGGALIVAGGIGNAIDRFTLGYVVDFIDTVFIEFPTFNVADIGVTCGFVLFFAGMLWSMRREDALAAAEAGESADTLASADEVGIAAAGDEEAPDACAALAEGGTLSGTLPQGSCPTVTETADFGAAGDKAAPESPHSGDVPASPSV